MTLVASFCSCSSPEVESTRFARHSSQHITRALKNYVQRSSEARRMDSAPAHLVD